jgi:hypothetical protein
LIVDYVSQIYFIGGKGEEEIVFVGGSIAVCPGDG